ncbi:MAG TPA: hypothetical protein VN743_03435 [Blastocatellia bacterium]|nr:hypothetical protein [Blastocatellia bacterium]
MNGVVLIVVLAIALAPFGSGQSKNGMTDRDGRELLGRWLKNVNGSQGGLIISIDDVSVRKALPTKLFYVLQYRQYPVAQALPEPLTYNNLFAVEADGKVEILADIKALETLFRSSLAPVKGKAETATALKAWLRLTQEFNQDGSFEFSIPENAFEIRADRNGISASGKDVVVPASGNRGEIRVQLIFDPAGKLTKVTENAQIIPGRRPQ